LLGSEEKTVMRTWCVALATLAVAGCMNFAKFDKRYEKKYCEEWAACDPTVACPSEELSDPSAESGVTCDDESTFDRKAANDCLDATWECDDSIPGFPAIRPAEVCSQVCDATEEAAA
jgi:hypothetical protein